MARSNRWTEAMRPIVEDPTIPSREAARRLGVHRVTIAAWRRGQVSGVQVGTRAKYPHPNPARFTSAEIGALLRRFEGMNHTRAAQEIGVHRVVVGRWRRAIGSTDAHKHRFPLPIGALAADIFRPLAWERRPMKAAA